MKAPGKARRPGTWMLDRRTGCRPHNVSGSGPPCHPSRRFPDRACPRSPTERVRTPPRHRDGGSA
jgi:hypothetical protein